MLGPNSSAQKYLTKFLGAVESYIHPANSGKWLIVITEIVVHLPKYLFDRLVVERYKPHPWKKPIPGKFVCIYLFETNNRNVIFNHHLF